MTSTTCPLCKFRHSTKLFNAKTEKSEFTIIQCQQCGLTRTFPMPDDSVLELHNKPQYYGEKENKFIPVIQNIRDRLSKIRAGKYLSMIRVSDRRPKILDIGCAEGRLLRSFLQCGCDCYGIEHSSYPKERFLDSDRIKYLTGDLSSFELNKEFFDIIIMWHVLEHMEDPLRITGIIHELLRPDGIFILAVPNFSSIEAGIFKDRWFHLDIPWHKYHFTERALQYLIEKNNFEEFKFTTFCFEQGIYGIVQSCLNLMGWQQNELYELMKGNARYARSVYLILQSFIGVLFLIPCAFFSFAASVMEKGSVLKVVLRKKQKMADHESI